MYPFLSIALLFLALVTGTTSAAQVLSPARTEGFRSIKLSMEPLEAEHEVFVGPGTSTTFTFDTELLHDEQGRSAVALEQREKFSLVDIGQTTLRLRPSSALEEGSRLRLMVRFKKGAAPSSAAFVLVVHGGQVERFVEVLRESRTVESYQREAREARLDAEQCRQDLARERATRGLSDGLVGLLISRVLNEEGVQSRDLRSITPQSMKAVLRAKKLISYRSAKQVALEVQLESQSGPLPLAWGDTEVSLVDRRGQTLKARSSWQSGPILLPGKFERLLVEVDAGPEEARGSYALTLKEAATGRTFVMSGVTFPELSASDAPAGPTTPE